MDFDNENKQRIIQEFVPGKQVTLAHLTLLSTWIPTPSYYFGINPVAWFICDLFFLFLIVLGRLRLSLLLLVGSPFVEWQMVFQNHSHKYP